MQSSSSKIYKKAIYKTHDILIGKRNPQGAIDFIKNFIKENNVEDSGIQHWLGLCYLEAAQLDNAIAAYLEIEGYYQAGFCELLKGNDTKANEYWLNIPVSEVQHWSNCLKTIIKGKIIETPTFLNLRNHLECDLGYLLKFKQETFANNILLLADRLVDFNMESYKFIGRALLNNGYSNASVKFLIDGQKLLPNDPEIYYHLGQYSLMVGARGEAITMFKHCKILSPSYTPADDRLKELNEKPV